MERVCQGFKGGGAFPYDDVWIDPCAVMKHYRTKPKSGGKLGETFPRVVVLGGSVIVASRELDEPKVFKVRKLADKMHNIGLGTWWVYEFQGSHLLCQVSEVLFKDGKERGWVELMKCEGSQQRKGLELWEVC